MDILILCAGKINFTHLPVSTNTTNSMVPINGKPVIGWILDDLISKELNRVTVVARTEDHHLKDFLTRTYSNRLDLQLNTIDHSHSILHSLDYGLSTIKGNQVGVILGDTLIRDSFEGKADFVYTHEVPHSHRWCLAVADEKGNVSHYLDKQKEVTDKPYMALCGYYQFTDITLLRAMTKQALADKKTELSQLLSLYQTYRPIRLRKANSWFDFGNIDNLLLSKQKLLQSRFFNSLQIDPTLNTITKVSELDLKLQNELNWYESLPPKLQVIAPRIISKERKNGQLHLTQEYYGYPTLAELFLFSNLDIEHWQRIIRKLLEIQKEFQQFPHTISTDDCREIYVHKTKRRIAQLCESDLYWEGVFQREAIEINGQTYANYSTLQEQCLEIAEHLCQTVEGAIIHGDFCFSNILFDFNNQIVRLIDPRGSFGSRGIYGDPRYDLAKLRHSIVGNYDYIVSDLFEVKATADQFQFDVFTPHDSFTMARLFDEAISAAGFHPLEIQFIEALLFISMLPLHQDKPQRQKAMYLTGLKLLNEVINKYSTPHTLPVTQ